MDILRNRRLWFFLGLVVAALAWNLRVSGVY